MNIDWKSKKVRIILAVIVFAVLVIGYLLWRKKKLTAKHKQLLEEKASLIAEQESLSKIVTQLEEMQSNFSDPEPAINNEIKGDWTQGNDEFPLNHRKNSQGPNVVAVQLWLQQYQGEELPKYGANGHYNSETDEAVRKVTNRDSISKKFFVKNKELLGIQNQLMN